MSMQRDKIKAYAREVAAQLGESEEGPVHQVELLLEHAGEEFVKSVLEETLKLEAAEGIKTEDGKRRRTPGGAFFYLAKGKLSPDVRQLIFPNFGLVHKGKVIEWHERMEHVKPLLEERPGFMRHISVVIQGRPGKIVKIENSVITTIAHRHRRTPLPKGVPFPPDEQTLYTVYMGAKQWENVEESLAKNKNDRMIVEGSCMLDAESGTIAIFATTVTTRRLEKTIRRSKSVQQEAEAADEPEPIEEDTPPAPTGVNEKLQQLYSAADTLRERIEAMEKKGQAGVAMTKKLLQTTEQQIKALEKQQGK